MHQRAMGVIFEMIFTRVRTFQRGGPEGTFQAQMHKTIATLPSTEFPNLTELREVLATPRPFRPERRSRSSRSPQNTRTGSSQRSVEFAARRRPNPTNDGEHRLVAACTLNRPLHPQIGRGVTPFRVLWSSWAIESRAEREDGSTST